MSLTAGTRLGSYAAVLSALLLLVSHQTTASQAGAVPPSSSTSTRVLPKVVTRLEPGFMSGPMNKLGTFRIELSVGADGLISDARISQPLAGAEALQTEALAELRKWTFKPARQDGAPVGSIVTVTFDLETRGAPRRALSTAPPRILPHMTIEGADDDFVEGAYPPGTPGLVPPRPTNSAALDYPDAARRLRLEGIVRVEVVVLASGRAGRARVIRSVAPELDAAALRSALRWQFEPARLNGQPVSAAIVLMLQFRWDGRSASRGRGEPVARA